VAIPISSQVNSGNFEAQINMALAGQMIKLGGLRRGKNSPKRRLIS
jgi:hypothetical protein